MISLVFLATLIDYLDRRALSVIAPILRDQFAMSNVAYSWVPFAFMLACTIMNSLAGVLIDWRGTHLGYALCMLWWSAATLLHTAAKGVWSLGVYRFLLGLPGLGELLDLVAQIPEVVWADV